MFLILSTQLYQFSVKPTTCPLQNGYYSLQRVTLSLISPKMKLFCLLPHTPSHPHQTPASTHFRLHLPKTHFQETPKSKISSSQSQFRHLFAFLFSCRGIVVLWVTHDRLPSPQNPYLGNPIGWFVLRSQS